MQLQMNSKNNKNNTKTQFYTGNNNDMSSEKKSIKINRGDIYNNNFNINKNVNTFNSRPYPNVNGIDNINQQKDISYSESIDKMLSLGKSFFVNGTIFIAVSTILVGGGIFFSGYDPIPVIEKSFIYKSTNDSGPSETIQPLFSLDLSKNLPSEDVFNKLYDFTNVTLGEIILDEDLYNSGASVFNSKLSKLATAEYSADLINNSALYTALESIYSSANRYPYSVTLTSIGSVTRNSKVLTKLSIDVNAVDDDLGFHVWNLAVFLNSENKIQDVKILAENKTLSNTRTPLDPSLAVLTNGINDSLSRSVNTFLKGITNESLYNKLNASSKPFNESQLKAFFSKLKMENINYEVLSEMFEISKGNGANFAITEVISTDFDGEPITNIILSIQSGENIYRYDLQYNRREKTLVGISSI